MKSKQVYFARNLLLTGVVVLAGCAAGVRKDSGAIVGELAVQRWNLLIQHQADKAYDFLAPGYRATTSREEYAKSMNNRPVAWKGVELVDSKCEQDVCKVHLKLAYNVSVNLHGTHEVKGNSPLEENWIRESDHWYVLPDNHAPTRKASPKSS